MEAIIQTLLEIGYKIGMGFAIFAVPSLAILAITIIVELINPKTRPKAIRELILYRKRIAVFILRHIYKEKINAEEECR